jgi:hypothetical protein
MEMEICIKKMFDIHFSIIPSLKFYLSHEIQEKLIRDVKHTKKFKDIGRKKYCNSCGRRNETKICSVFQLEKMINLRSRQLISFLTKKKRFKFSDT